MTLHLLLIASASFMVSFVVVSRAGAWVVLLIAILKTPEPGTAASRSIVSLGPLVLHSGPWGFALVAAATCYAAISLAPMQLRALLAGASLAVLVILVGLWWKSAARSASEPLTPGRLLSIRRRFFWGNSLFFTVASSSFVAFSPLGVSPSQREILVLLTALAAFAGGWGWSWFMWQWYGEQLEVNERARLARECTKKV